MTRHGTGGLQEYGNKEQATEIGNEVVTQRKSSELPRRDLEGSEVQGNIEHAEHCVEPTISQSIVVERKLSLSEVDRMVQETEKSRDEDEVNELKHEAEMGLEKIRVFM